MLHIASAFESSLRKAISSSSSSKKHNSCKGSAHGTGNYGCYTEKECDLDKSPFQRNNSKRWSTRSNVSRKISETSFDTESVTSEVDKNQLQRNTKSRWSLRSTSTRKIEKKNSSISSENFSESDSLDSLGEKTKSSDTTDDSAKKPNDICSRLYNSVTKSSVAKTAKMRHLDIFDVEENNWIGGLRKNVSEESEKQKLAVDNENFSRARNGSVRKKSIDTDSKPEDLTTKVIKDSQDNYISRNKSGSVKKPDSDKPPPKAPPRSSFRNKRNKYKFFSKAPCIAYEEILFMSLNKKTNGFFRIVDKTNCFKDFGETTENNANRVRFLNIFLKTLINLIII